MDQRRQFNVSPEQVRARMNELCRGYMDPYHDFMVCSCPTRNNIWETLSDDGKARAVKNFNYRCSQFGKVPDGYAISQCDECYRREMKIRAQKLREDQERAEQQRKQRLAKSKRQTW